MAKTGRLNQVLAVEKGTKTRSMAEIGEIYKLIQKPALFNGFSKTFEALDESGEKLPPESTRVQATARGLLETASRAWSELMAVTARKDWTNCVAKADVVVDGKVLVPAAPVSYLLFLEKSLTDIRTMVASIPVLDPAESWSYDPNSGLYRSGELQTHRTKKTQKAIVLYHATPEHPAQTQLLTEDVISGHWKQVKQSGAMPAPKKKEMLDRVEALLKAVKEAREEANMITETPPPPVADAVFTYILGDQDETAPKKEV